MRSTVLLLVAAWCFILGARGNQMMPGDSRGQSDRSTLTVTVVIPSYLGHVHEAARLFRSIAARAIDDDKDSETLLHLVLSNAREILEFDRLLQAPLKDWCKARKLRMPPLVMHDVLDLIHSIGHNATRQQLTRLVGHKKDGFGKSQGVGKQYFQSLKTMYACRALMKPPVSTPQLTLTLGSSVCVKLDSESAMVFPTSFGAIVRDWRRYGRQVLFTPLTSDKAAPHGRMVASANKILGKGAKVPPQAALDSDNPFPPSLPPSHETLWFLTNYEWIFESNEFFDFFDFLSSRRVIVDPTGRHNSDIHEVFVEDLFFRFAYNLPSPRRYTFVDAIAKLEAGNDPTWEARFKALRNMNPVEEHYRTSFSAGDALYEGTGSHMFKCNGGRDRPNYGCEKATLRYISHSQSPDDEVKNRVAICTSNQLQCQWDVLFPDIEWNWKSADVALAGADQKWDV